MFTILYIERIVIMNFFDVLTMIGGLCLFLFGMSVMGDSLERRAGEKLSSILGKLTTNKWAGFFTGLAVTAVIQSSSATTVMVVGFVAAGQGGATGGAIRHAGQGLCLGEASIGQQVAVEDILHIAEAVLFGQPQRRCGKQVHMIRTHAVTDQ